MCDPEIARRFEAAAKAALRRGEQIVGYALERGHWRFAFAPIERQRPERLESRPRRRGVQGELL